MAREEKRPGPCVHSFPGPLATTLPTNGQCNLPRLCWCDKKQDLTGSLGRNHPQQDAGCSLQALTYQSLSPVQGAAAHTSEISEWVGGKKILILLLIGSRFPLSCSCCLLFLLPQPWGGCSASECCVLGMGMWGGNASCR